MRKIRDVLRLSAAGMSKRKIAVAMIFWLGAFCAVAAIVRTVLLDQSIRSVVSSASYDHVGELNLETFGDGVF